MSAIGIIGAGEVARLIAPRAALAGHEVLLSNSRGPHTLTGLAREVGARAVDVDEAAEAAIVLVAVPWPRAQRVLSARGRWDGRILIDSMNAMSGSVRDRAAA